MASGVPVSTSALPAGQGASAAQQSAPAPSPAPAPTPGLRLPNGYTSRPASAPAPVPSASASAPAPEPEPVETGDAEATALTTTPSQWSQEQILAQIEREGLDGPKLAGLLGQLMQQKESLEKDLELARGGDLRRRSINEAMGSAIGSLRGAGFDVEEGFEGALTDYFFESDGDQQTQMAMDAIKHLGDTLSRVMAESQTIAAENEALKAAMEQAGVPATPQSLQTLVGYIEGGSAKSRPRKRARSDMNGGGQPVGTPFTGQGYQQMANVVPSHVAAGGNSAVTSIVDRVRSSGIVGQNFVPKYTPPDAGDPPQRT